MRIPKPFSIQRRNDSKTFLLTLKYTCGLPERVCAEWSRRSFQDLPDELAHYRNPKTKSGKPDVSLAEAGALALIAYLKQKQSDGGARRITAEDVTVGEWVKKFTAIETSPRTGINASKNRPYSPGTVNMYDNYYECHIKGDPITKLKMTEVEEEDILDFNTRMSVKKLKDGRPMGGTRTYKGVLGLVRTAFGNYQRKNRKWLNPFLYIDSPKYSSKTRDALPEEEILKIFEPGVLRGTMELAVGALMFYSGLRRAEVFALKPEDLDWHTPKITVRRAWQMFESKDRVLGPPKSKKPRDTLFDPILQEAIKKLWEENGKHEYVICYKNGKTPGPSWIKGRFPKWLERAGIELGGREIVPHSSRHSLASLLEAKGVPIRYIQEILGHSDEETTKIYLHSPERMIREVSKKITEAREKGLPAQKEKTENIINFKVS